MRTRRRATIDDLRLAIDCLPRRTRIAMLDGIESDRIIVGAYTSPDGICPMLAAHRRGGRTSLISFAQAWDRLAFRDERRPRARPATERELLILRSHLKASLLADAMPAGELAAARREHHQLVARRQARARTRRERERARRERPGDPNRARELAGRSGWAWTRIVRRYDDYERIRREVAPAQPAADAEPAVTA